MSDLITVTLDIEGNIYQRKFDPRGWDHEADYPEYMGEHIGDMVARTIRQHYRNDQVFPASKDA